MLRWAYLGCLIACMIVASGCDDYTNKYSSEEEGVSRFPIADTTPVNELEPIEIPFSESLTEKALFLLQSRCASCHGETSTGLGNINYITDIKQMIDRGLVIPGNAVGSPLYISMANYSMPINTPMPAEEIQLIGDWINEGAQESVVPPAPEEVIDLTAQFSTQADIISTVANDVQQLAAAGVNVSRIRYFSAAHLNDGVNSGEVVKAFGQALAKVLNSLSWEPNLVKPVAINDSMVLYRVDISQLGWSNNLWNRIVVSYPFDVTDVNNSQDPNRDDANQQDQLESIKNLINTTQVPLVRLDWFSHRTTQPEMYHDILDIPQNILVLEDDLGLDVFEEISGAVPARVAFINSGVSAQNRMMERHQTAFGAYWKSYDFASNNGEQNVISRPLGPQFVDNPYSNRREFEHDGGEIIFNLPNGLQAYVLADGQDQRLDTAPTEIVQDFLREDRIVHNGISCIACHSRGMNRNYDEVRMYAMNNPGNFNNNDFQAVLSMYVPNAQLDAFYDQDDAKFQGALQQLGVDGQASEPVSFVAYRYEDDLTLPMVAADQDLTVQELTAAIGNSRTLRNIIGDLRDPGATISREAYEANYLLIYDQLND